MQFRNSKLIQIPIYLRHSRAFKSVHIYRQNNRITEEQVVLYPQDFTDGISLPPKNYHTPSSLWSKTTLIKGGVGGAGIDPPS